MTGTSSRTRHTDRGELTVLAARIATFAVGPLTVLAIGVFFSPTLQGYYYAFTSIVAGSQLFEAGIATAIIQISAHEAGSLQPGNTMALSRMAGVLRFSLKWYCGVAAVMVICISAAGALAFSGHRDGVEWLLPWLLLVFFAAADLALQGFFVVLEGTGHIVPTYAYRLTRVVALNVVLIFAVALGAGLFGLGIGMAAATAVGVTAVIRHRGFFGRLLRLEAKRVIDWRSEILPFQGRIAVSWMAGYFSASCFTPLLLATSGAVEAGQMGMTMLLTSACTSLAASFIQAKAPTLGALAGAQRWTELVAVFRAKAVRSIIVAAALLTMAAIFVMSAQALDLPLANRILPWPALCILALGTLAYHIEGVFAFFMRAQKREPYFVLELIGAALILPVAALTSGTTGPFGLAVLFAAVHVTVLLPIATTILVKDVRRVRRLDVRPAQASAAPSGSIDNSVTRLSPSAVGAMAAER